MSGQDISDIRRASPGMLSQLLDEAEVVRSTTDGWERPTPLSSHALPPFPVDAFPSWLAPMVSELAESTQTPVDLGAMLALALLSACSAKKFLVAAGGDWKEPVNLFVCVAMAPAARKSAVFGEITAPIRDFEKQEVARQGAKLQAHTTKRKLLEQQVEQSRKAAASEKDETKKRDLTDLAIRQACELDQMKEMARPKFLVDDITPERMASALAEQGGRLALLSPEGGLFELMGGRYSSNGGSNFEVYLKAHAGEDLRVDRQGRPPNFVRAPALTVGLAVQPAVIRAFADRPEFHGRGLLARFLYSLPANLVGRRKALPAPVSDSARIEFGDQVLRLLSMAQPQDSDGEPVETLIRLSEPAHARLTEFRERLEPKLGELGELAPITEWAGKLPGAIVRIAGLLHISRHATESGEHRITGETMRDAIRIGETLIPHALHAYDLMGEDAEMDNARVSLALLQKEGWRSFSQRDLHRRLRSRFRKPDQVAKAIAILTEHHYVRPLPETDPSDRVGRPRSPRFEVNPQVHGQNGHNGQNARPHDVD